MGNFKYTIEALEAEAKGTPITLALQESDDVDGGVDLVKLDGDGDVELYILTINPTGTFFRHQGGNFASPDPLKTRASEDKLVLDE